MLHFDSVSQRSLWIAAIMIIFTITKERCKNGFTCFYFFAHILTRYPVSHKLFFFSSKKCVKWVNCFRDIPVCAKNLSIFLSNVCIAFKVVIPGRLETFQAVWKLSRPSGNFLDHLATSQGLLETFQDVWKLSRPYGNFPDFSLAHAVQSKEILLHLGFELSRTAA